MKTRKLLIAALSITLIISMMNFGSTAAKAEVLDEADLCLMDTIELMIDEPISSLTYDRQEIFNFDLEQFGFAYELNINGKVGFALMIKRAYYYEVTELYLNKTLPFAQSDGLPVYLTPLCYIEYSGNQYIDIENGLVLNPEQLKNLKDKGFGYQDDFYEGSTGGVIVRTTVSYDSRSLEEGRISGGIPGYFNENPELTGACAVQAGSVVLGYYGRYFPQLTPGFTVGMPVGNSYFYFNQGYDGIIQGIIEDLAVRMGTNVGGPGTTAAGFRSGLSSYVQSKGLNLTYTSVASNNNLNYALFKSQVANLKPSVLFFNTYNMFPSPPVMTKGNEDILNRKVYPGLHVMIGYGYKKYTYFKNGSSFRTDTYLEVYTGIGELAQGFVKLYDYSILVEAYAINIY